MSKEIHKKVIKDLGGSSAVAKLCNVTVSAVSQWIAEYGDGIPEARLMYLQAIRPAVFKKHGIYRKAA